MIKDRNIGYRKRLIERYVGDTIRFKIKVANYITTRTFKDTDLSTFDNIRIMFFTNPDKFVYTASIKNGKATIDTDTNRLIVSIDSDTTQLFELGEMRCRIIFDKNGEIASAESPALLIIKPTIFMNNNDGFVDPKDRKPQVELI